MKLPFSNNVFIYLYDNILYTLKGFFKETKYYYPVKVSTGMYAHAFLNKTPQHVIVNLIT